MKTVKIFNLRFAILALSVSFLSACVAPPSIINQPISARSQPTVMTNASNGAIFQAGTARMFFEEPSARRVGDILVVTIEETLSAVNKANSSNNRNGSLTLSGSANIPYMPKVFDQLMSATAKINPKNDFSGKGETNSSNTFKGTIAVTVTDVFSNGNLSIGGEKKIAVNGQTSLIRFSGVANPNDIKAGNIISSTKIADARIEQVGEGSIADANTMGWMQHVFLSVWPF